MRKTTTSLAIFGLLVAGLRLTAEVRGGLIADGDFESAVGVPATTYYTAGQNIGDGSWNVTQGQVGVDTQNFYVYAGNNSVFLDGSKQGPDSLSQTLSTMVGQTYTVSFWANADISNTVDVTLGGNEVLGFPGSVVENGFPSSVWLGNSSQFAFYSGTVTATSTISDLVLTGTNLQPGGSGVTIEIDNVSVTSVPEPSSIALLAIGAIGLAIAARRKMRK